MSSKTNKDLIYYGLVVSIITPLIYAFVIWLNWPLLAAVVFGGALFLHLLNMSKHSKDFFFRLKEEGFSDSQVSHKLLALFGQAGTEKNDTDS